MKPLVVHNPFNAPVYHEDTVDTTMEVSRALARDGAPHGTVIAADFQSAGRGRIKDRVWDMEKGTNLAFTILLRFPGIADIPRALTLRTGLAVSRAIEDCAPALIGSVYIKWPNDVLIGNKKVVGILTEADGGNVHIGIGVNVGQQEFPDFLRDKATSISLATGQKMAEGERYVLLEKILAHLHAGADDWRERIEARLYLKDRRVTFAAGPADSPHMVTGILTGIGPDGELLLLPDGGVAATAFTTGELTCQYPC